MVKIGPGTTSNVSGGRSFFGAHFQGKGTAGIMGQMTSFSGSHYRAEQAPTSAWLASIL
jgi:hypothetical protein